MNQQEKHSQERHQAIETLRELISDIQICMLATHSPEHGLRSRPMITGRHEFDGDLWFFTHKDDPKVAEIQNNPLVNLVYSQPDRDRYVSISGQAELVCDQQKTELLWKDELNEWFPKGPSDSKLVLIRVHVCEAEYWDADVNQLSEAVKALFFTSIQATKHGKLDWKATT
tara:strand:+ start:2613 stop:3125 length:513 start_codon:yes stop_codon:yes gene_type:complete